MAPAAGAADAFVSGVAPVGYWNAVWRRLRRDKFAVLGGLYVIFVLLMLFVVAPIASHLLGHGPNTAFARGADINRAPVPPWTHVSLTELDGGSGFGG